MAAFATAEQLRLMLRLASIDTAAADLLLELVSDAVRGEIGQRIDLVTGDMVTLNGTGNDTLLLPELPVLDVVSVTEEGDLLVEGTDYTWSPAGVLTRIGRDWPCTPRSVVVVNDHGYDPVPGVARTVTLQAAARAWLNPGQLSSEQLGNYSRSWASSGPGGGITFTDYETRLLDQLRP